MSAPALDPLIEGYLSYLDKVGRKAPRTVIDVRCTLRRAVTQLAAIRPGIDLWRLRLEDFLLWFEAGRERGLTPACLIKDVSHVRGFLEYSWRSGRTERNVLDGFSLQHTLKRSVPKHLTIEEAERLVQATTAGVPRRDRLIILLLYGCGLRTGELCALDVADVNRERQELIVQKAKRDRPRVIPIPGAVYTELLAYMLDQRQRGALLRTRAKGARVRQKDICDVVASVVERAGLHAGITARTLRHSFATHLMDRGVDLAIIASLMGHRSPQETGVYLHVLPQRPETAVRTLPIGAPS